MSDDSRIPVSVLTGFLGSGKTTVLNHLLRQPTLADTVVVINEFGEIGLDHLLIEKTNENLVLLSNGCLCCTVRVDIAETLGDLIAQRDIGRIGAFPRVVIETTGLADPAPILHTLMAEPQIIQHYRLDGVIATVDGVNGARTLDKHMEAVKQVAMADRILLTKGDLTSGDDLTALRMRIDGLNPGVPLVEVIDGQVETSDFLSVDPYDPQTKNADVQRWLRTEAVVNASEHELRKDYEGPHHHHVNRHDDHVRAYCVTIDEPVRWDAFSHWLELMSAMRGENMLRIKGLVGITEQPDRPIVVHGVQSIIHPVVQLDAWPSSDRRTRLVFIVLDTPRELIERTLCRFAQVDPDHIESA